MADAKNISRILLLFLNFNKRHLYKKTTISREHKVFNNLIVSKVNILSKKATIIQKIGEFLVLAGPVLPNCSNVWKKSLLNIWEIV